MDMQGIAISERGPFGDEAPAPLSLETLEVVEQPVLLVLRALRSQASTRQAQAAGAAEYASWQAVRPR